MHDKDRSSFDYAEKISKSKNLPCDPVVRKNVRFHVHWKNKA